MKTHEIRLKDLRVFLKQNTKLRKSQKDESNLSLWDSSFLKDAEAECVRLNHHYIGCEHLFLALIKEKHCTVLRFLEKMGLDAGRLRGEVFGILGSVDIVDSQCGTEGAPESR